MATINLRTQCYLIRINIHILHIQFNMPSKSCNYTNIKSLAVYTVTTPHTTATIQRKAEESEKTSTEQGWGS